jgi:hypothetical protein
MANAQNCDSYSNIPSSQSYRSYSQYFSITLMTLTNKQTSIPFRSYEGLHDC